MRPRTVVVSRVRGGATPNPDSAWVAQQARNLTMALQEEGRSPTLLIHDRDSKFTGPFDEVFRSEGRSGRPGLPLRTSMR